MPVASNAGFTAGNKKPIENTNPPGPNLLYGILLPVWAILEMTYLWLPVYALTAAGGFVGLILVIAVLVDVFKLQRAIFLGWLVVLAVIASWPITVLSPDDLSGGPWWDVSYYWLRGFEAFALALAIDRKRRVWLYGSLTALNVVPSIVLVNEYRQIGASAQLPLWADPFLWGIVPIFMTLTVICWRQWSRGRR